MLKLCSQGNIVLEPHPTFPEETVPTELILLHGSKTFDNVDNVRTTIQRQSYQSQKSGRQLPRDVLKQSVIEQELVQPNQKKW